jgi:hypothetical protein
MGDPKRGRQTLRHYVEAEWFPNHVIETKTRENYTYLLERYILPELGSMRMVDILPGHVREWIGTLQADHGARPPTIREAKVVLDAILAAGGRTSGRARAMRQIGASVAALNAA